MSARERKIEQVYYTAAERLETDPLWTNEDSGSLNELRIGYDSFKTADAATVEDLLELIDKLRHALLVAACGHRMAQLGLAREELSHKMSEQFFLAASGTTLDRYEEVEA